MLLPLIMLISLLISACAPVLIVGTATGVSIATDHRTAGIVLEDQSIELKAIGIIQSDKALSKDSHIVIISYNNIVLLVGQAPNESVKKEIAGRIKKIEKVRSIVNEINIGKAITLSNRSYDSWMTTKVKSVLLGAKGVGSSHIKVITEDSVVFLMGIVTPEQAKSAASTVQQVKGVRRVVKVFEYVK